MKKNKTNNNEIVNSCSLSLYAVVFGICSHILPVCINICINLLLLGQGDAIEIHQYQ